MKGPKCALFYERRSGNNWCKGKNDRQPAIEIQGEKIETYKRAQAYKYLSKSLSIRGEDPKQVEAFIEEFKETLNKIDASSLPIPLKLSAFNNMAPAKILHHFDNRRIEEQQLREMDSKDSCVVRNRFGLYPKTTDKVLFIGRLEGGLGIKKAIQRLQSYANCKSSEQAQQRRRKYKVYSNRIVKFGYESPGCKSYKL